MKKRRSALAALLMCALLICSLVPLMVNAKNGEIINNTNGLISACVNDVCQTTDGFIWIAQYEGLTRFDGSYYKLIKDVNIGGSEVRLEQITNVKSDSHNRLYIGTKSYGMIVYENGVYSAVTEGRGINVNDIYVCGERVYVATTEGAYMYSHNTVTWLEDSMKGPVLSIAAQGYDVYYVDKSGNVFQYNGKSEPFYEDKAIKTVRTFDGRVYLGSQSGTLICVDSDQVTEYPVSEDDPINELYMQQGVLVIGTDKGVFMLDDDKALRIKELEKYSGINHLIFDFEGGMWLATTVGLVEIHRFGVRNLFRAYDLQESLTNACIYYNDMLYAGTDNGLVVIDENNACTVSNDLTKKLQGVRVRDFAVYNGELYVATYSSKEYDVLVFDGNNVRNISAAEMLGNSDPDSISAQGQVRCFANFKNGLLIGTNYGITLLNNGQYQTINMDFRPLSISVGNNGIYACTDGNGISIVDFDTKTSQTLPGTEGKTILKTIEYEDGLIYTLGTCLYYQKNNELINIKTPNVGSLVNLIELPNELAILTGSGMLLVDKNTLFDKDVKVNKKLNAANGLESGVTANGRAFYLQKNNTIYLNCQNGAYVYNLSSRSGDVAAPRLVITDITVDSKSVSLQDIVKMQSHANRIEIKLSIPTFMSRDNLTVYYQMEGVDNTPLNLDFARNDSVEYTNLKGGKYVLKMYAVNDEGIKSNEIKLSIDKSFRWVEKWSSRILVFVFDTLVFVGIIGLVLHEKMKRERRRSEHNKRITEESLEAIASAIDAKDSYTNGHSIRVAKLAECIGKHLKMSKDELENLYYIGLMHDVGKIGIPDNILNKPGRLTNDEYEIMKTHPVIGNSILKSIHSIPHLEDGVCYHHEKYDGTGYPNKLKMDEIPLTGKIIACADAFDAMATRRCYKEKMPDESIISEFERCSGTHFEPDLVKIVVECIKNGEFDKIIMQWYSKTDNT